MDKYYNAMTENYCIPVSEYTAKMDREVKEFLRQNTDYFLMYLPTEYGYTENMWCITNWLE